MNKNNWLKVWVVIFGSFLRLGIICAYAFMPLALLKALNVLFQLGIPYNLETYCLSEILILIFGNPNFSFSGGLSYDEWAEIKEIVTQARYELKGEKTSNKEKKP